MRVCINHPDRAGKWLCQKFDLAFCDDCCRCSHPEGYCKFRPQCGVRQICLETGSAAESAGDPNPQSPPPDP